MNRDLLHIEKYLLLAELKNIDHERIGKQMNKETKLRIHNITAEAALKFGSEAWVLKKRE